MRRIILVQKNMRQVKTFLVTLVALGLSISSGKAQTPNTNWYTANPTASSFSIANADELAGLAKIVNDSTDNFAGKTITLTAILTLLPTKAAQVGYP